MVDFRNLFSGSWTFSRTVTGMFPQEKSINGQVEFVMKKGQLVYQESGSYDVDDMPIDFETSYVYDIQDALSCHVLFPDGRLFYKLSNPNELVEHLCGADHYRGRFDIIDENQWTLTWQIQGPRKKNVCIHTQFYRVMSAN